MRSRLDAEVRDLKRSLKFLTALQALTLGLLIRRGTVSCQDLATELELLINESSPDEAELLTLLQAQLSPVN